VKSLTPGIDCSLYVDDFLICYRSKHMHTIERQLQQCLNRIQNWADANGFKFSRTKTVCMHFCNLRTMHPEPDLTLDGSKIPILNEHKFLGIIFDSKLSFIPHIKYLKAKCHKALNILKVVSRFDWGADRVVLLRLYRALVRSKLDYGSIVYGSARESYIKVLDPIHHQGLRIATGAFRTSPVESLYVEADEESLYRRRTRLALLYAIKLRSTPANPAFDTVFNPKYSDIFATKTSAVPTFGIRVKSLIDDMNIDINQIATYRLPDIPIWDMNVPTILYDLRVGKKSEVYPTDFLSHFHVIQDKYNEYQFIYTDGSKDDARVGCAAVYGRQFLRERLPDTASVYTAELHAICIAMHHIINSQGNRFVLCVDSMSCLQAIENLHVEHPIVLEILELFYSSRTLKKDIQFCWVPSHMGIRGNEYADEVAKAALNDQPQNMALPYSDFRHIIHNYIRKQWINFWSLQVNNKLHLVKPTLGRSAWSSREKRREEIVLCRIRIGHAYLTHRYLLAGDDPPECVSCQETLTVSHILVDCAEYSHIRERYFEVQTLRELLNDVEPITIINFVREAGLLFLF